MKNFRTWAQQKKATGLQLDVDGFLAAIQSELAPEDDETQGQALVELASAIRTDLLADNASPQSGQMSRRIIGLLQMAEGKLQEDPLPAMSIATHLYYDCGDPTNAYPHALRAVDKAKRQHEMFRQTVGELIRISIALNKYEEVESLLRLLTEYTPKQFAMEIPLESDFLIRLPEGAIDETVLAVYRKRLEDGRSQSQL